MDLNAVTDFVPATLDGFRSGDAWLAGGTWLFSEPQPEVRRLLDLTAFAWPALTVRSEGLEIAATCTLAELARFEAPADWAAAPLFQQCCSALLGSFKVWNTATVGGNICLALPAGPMTSLTAALDGIATIWSPDGSVRRVAIVDLVTGAGTTAVAAGELLRSVFLPASALRARTAFRQFSLSPVGRSAVLVIGRRAADGPAVLTVTASTVRPVQLRFDSLPTSTALRDALAASPIVYHDDIHGHPAWRRALTTRYLDEVRDELAAT
jgi:CO/xanthine dehydrogenase FAD-binding subunit